MRLAVSNIAWSPESRRQAYALLIENGIGGLEVAPGLLFREAVDPFDPTEAEARSVRDELDGSGLELVSMQSLLFGVQGAALFEGPGPLTRLRFGMDRAIAFAERFSIPNMVFGCPLQRAVPVGMDHSEALKFGAEQFRKMGDRAASAGTVIAVEFNPEAYGTNFLNTVEQAQAFVTEVSHPAVRLCFDVGAMHMNHAFEKVDSVIRDAIGQINHVHISEAELAPSPVDQAQAARVMKELSRDHYSGWVSIEMKAVDDNLQALRGGVSRLVGAFKESVG